jgi:hypothetical protein
LKPTRIAFLLLPRVRAPPGHEGRLVADADLELDRLAEVDLVGEELGSFDGQIQGHGEGGCGDADQGEVLGLGLGLAPPGRQLIEVDAEREVVRGGEVGQGLGVVRQVGQEGTSDMRS